MNLRQRKHSLFNEIMSLINYRSAEGNYVTPPSAADLLWELEYAFKVEHFETESMKISLKNAQERIDVLEEELRRQIKHHLDYKENLRRKKQREKVKRVASKFNVNATKEEHKTTN